MRNKQWIVACCDSAAVSNLAAAGFSPLTAAVLSSRGITSPEKARAFLSTDAGGLHDPFLLKDMDAAVLQIRQAVSNGEKIAVYGDYDVDGVTATCVMVKYLRSKGADCAYYIPDRISEGYGLNTAALESLSDKGVRLLITVDSGITAVEETKYARSLGMNVVITDHHECRDILPPAAAVVNPRIPGTAYPYRELAGVGVAFKLICAIEGGDGARMLEEYGDLVALGTIADVMQITGENRIIVARGLKGLENTKNQGLKCLMRQSGMEGKRITAKMVGFIMAPRVNAAGRLGTASRAVELFLTCDAGKAEELAAELCEQNRLRQIAENDILNEAMERLKTEHDPHKDHAIVMSGEGWHNGVIGIVSSRITDKFGVPSILISTDGESGKGSGRSVSGFNLLEALEKNADLLQKYGGHSLAVGLSIEAKNIGLFRERISACAAGEAEAGEIAPKVFVDCEARAESLSAVNVRGLSEMEPFGTGNPQPLLLMRDAAIDEMIPISSDRHLKMTIEKDSCRFTAFVFGMGMENCPFVSGDRVDIVFSPEINVYFGRESVQLVIRDIRLSEDERGSDGRAMEIYERFKSGGRLTKSEVTLLMPSKQDIVSIWRFIRSRSSGSRLTIGAPTLYRRIRRESRTPLNIGKLILCLDVFSEFDFFSFEETNDELHISLHEYEGKADINSSKTIQKLNRAMGNDL